MRVLGFLLLFFILDKASFSSDKDLFTMQFGFPKKIPLSFRNGPGKEYPVVLKVESKNIIFHIMHKIDDWCYIKFHAEYNGWINCASISKQKSASIITEDTSLYRIPNDEKIGFLKKDLKVKVLKCNYRWCRISIKSDKIKQKISGWVKRRYIWGLEIKDSISKEN